MSGIKKLFDLLDDWRHLPAYQLERRADIFFAIYLKEIIEKKYNAKVGEILPEFPVRIGTISKAIPINRSFKIDYVLITSDLKRCFFVELKTDQNSRRTKQDWYLKKSKEVGLQKLIGGILEIYRHTKSKNKYRYLLSKLEKSKLIRINKNIFNITNQDIKIEIVYIQPQRKEEEKGIISFNDIVNILKNKPDELSQRFAKSLINWKDIEAGKE